MLEISRREIPPAAQARDVIRALRNATSEPLRRRERGLPPSPPDTREPCWLLPYADLTPDESTKAARGAEAGWRGRRWWRMCELQPPGAVYQHHGKAQCSPSVRSKRASQGKSQALRRAQRQSVRGRQADSRATHRASVRARQGRRRALCSQVDGMQAASWASLHAECSTSPQKACLCHSSARALMLLLM